MASSTVWARTPALGGTLPARTARRRAAEGDTHRLCWRWAVGADGAIGMAVPSSPLKAIASIRLHGVE